MMLTQIIAGDALEEVNNKLRLLAKIHRAEGGQQQQNGWQDPDNSKRSASNGRPVNGTKNEVDIKEEEVGHFFLMLIYFLLPKCCAAHHLGEQGLVLIMHVLFPNSIFSLIIKHFVLNGNNNSFKHSFQKLIMFRDRLLAWIRKFGPNFSRYRYLSGYKGNVFRSTALANG